VTSVRRTRRRLEAARTTASRDADVTSCGWFFDELSGLETVQVIQYAAGRADRRQVFDVDPRPASWKACAREEQIPEHRDGAEVYRKFVQPAIVDLPTLAAHYAISSMFQSYPDKAEIYCYAVDGKLMGSRGG